MSSDEHYGKITRDYDRLAMNGLYATQAPQDRGGRKAEYVSAVFDAALRTWMLRINIGDRILDFGCGTGVFTRQVAGRAGHVTGVDISPGILQCATDVCAGLDNVTLLQVDGERLQLPDSHYDWLVARESLCYVPDSNLGRILAEFHRILKPGGGFLLLDQVSDNPRWQIHPGAPNMIKRAPGFLLEELRKAGFILHAQAKVRSPRFAWIYPIGFGILPRSAIPLLARWEVMWHRLLPSKSRRWWNALYVLRKASNE